jgi:hypothetical protein
VKNFASIQRDNGLRMILNTDYIVKIDLGLDPKEGDTVHMAGGEFISLSPSEGNQLVSQLNQCCEKAAEQPAGGGVAVKLPTKKTLAKGVAKADGPAPKPVHKSGRNA